jgi:hypothetical protein
LFENGKIFDNLNPSITEPAQNNKREINLKDDDQLTVNLAMLKTQFDVP